MRELRQGLWLKDERLVRNLRHEEIRIQVLILSHGCCGLYMGLISQPWTWFERASLRRRIRLERLLKVVEVDLIHLLARAALLMIITPLKIGDDLRIRNSMVDRLDWLALILLNAAS